MKTIAALLVLAAAGSVANAELVVNGGFEAGNMSGWTQGAGINFTGVLTSPVHSGGFACRTGPDPVNTISQTLVGVNAGDTVSVSFWMGLFGTGTPNSFSATLDGQNIMAPITNWGTVSYTQFSANIVVTSANPTLVFTIYNSPSWFMLDDVSATATPTPGAAALLGLGGLVAGRRRRA